MPTSPEIATRASIHCSPRLYPIPSVIVVLLFRPLPAGRIARPGIFRYTSCLVDWDDANPRSARWAAQNPFPDPAAWAAVEDPRARLRPALTELYRFYADTEDMMGNVLRDAPIVEPLEEIMDDRWKPYMDSVVETLARGWAVDAPDEGADAPDEVADAPDKGADAPDKGAERPSLDDVRAALRVAVDFRTWRMLSASTPDSEAAVEVAAQMVGGVSGGC